MLLLSEAYCSNSRRCVWLCLEVANVWYTARVMKEQAWTTDEVRYSGLHYCWMTFDQRNGPGSGRHIALGSKFSNGMSISRTETTIERIVTQPPDEHDGCMVSFDEHRIEVPESQLIGTSRRQTRSCTMLMISPSLWSRSQGAGWTSVSIETTRDAAIRRVWLC